VIKASKKRDKEKGNSQKPARRTVHGSRLCIGTISLKLPVTKHGRATVDLELCAQKFAEKGGRGKLKKKPKGEEHGKNLPSDT